MGDNLYVDYWREQLPAIINQFKQGVTLVELTVPGLADFGNRDHYRSNFRIEEGKQFTPVSAQAHGRDLFQVLMADEYFKVFSSDKTIQVRISKSLHLSMEVLPSFRPDFFTEEDFELLEKYATEDKDNSNEDHVNTYNALKNVYLKTEYWANEIKTSVFPQGYIHAIKRPTNQANRFWEYHWAKIYPDDKSWFAGILAFTVSIDTDWQFIVKIDTVNLNGEKRQQYEQIRGDYYNSPIVRIFSSEEILEAGWEHLITLSVNVIEELRPFFKKIFAQLMDKPNTMINHRYQGPLNTILYGPPGTGKTFCTFRKAAAIANPNIEDVSQEEVLTEYRRLMAEGRIEFVTFHQNYSYEDFVLGIRPNLTGDDMKFTRHEGVFFRICKHALKNYKDSLSGVTYQEPTFEEVLDKFLEPVTVRDEPIEINTKSGISSFEIIARNPKNLSFKKASGTTDHTLSLDTLKGIYNEERAYDAQGLGVYYYPLVERMKSLARDLRREVGKIELRNYILIIDEINRANISRVFGELISLLEDDKRIGMSYELQVTLPNGEKFGVPPNLYILGTMNTADKSIALVDIALRRRFDFEPMYPKDEVIDKLVPSPYNQLLKKLNQRVREQKGADFMVGHAYFIPQKTEGILDFVKVMNHKVIPLLNEYFYNQRDNPVYRLLKSLEPDMGGCTVVEDGFVGTRVNSAP